MLNTGMKYFDSAAQIAQKLKNNLLLAEATFAKGRVYDAWNKEPEKTIQYFKEAAAMFQTLSAKYTRYMYVRHLIAHAYDKINDSTRCVEVLKDMYREIVELSLGLKKRMPFIPEMALISTQVRNYDLAEKILKLVDERWIQNDSNTYNYRDHYIITQSRLDVYSRRSGRYPYLDSLTKVYNNSTNAFDSVYYTQQLYEQYGFIGKYDSAVKYLTLNKNVLIAINTQEGISNMQNQLLKMQLASVEEEQYLALRNSHTRALALWLLSALLVIITAMSLIILRRNRLYKAQQKELQETNDSLDEKNRQNLLLNKEIHHRIKNNLHMVISLLNMQQRKAKNPEVFEHLQNAKMRIESISSLHEQLVDGNEQNIDFTAFIKKLINNVIECFHTNNETITHFDIQPIHLNNSQSLALSLILNEWITNSVKHSQSNFKELHIYITIKKEASGMIEVAYYDNGNIMTTGNRNEGLGTQIINLLCKQLQGKLSTAPDNHFRYKLTIPDGNKNNNLHS